MAEAFNPARRRFLGRSALAAGGLLLGFYLPPSGPRPARAAEAGKKGPFTPNAFLRVAADGEVTVIVNKSEMGQGVYTALPQIVAEELDADWSRIRVEAAPVDPVYNHTAFGIQMTGGSTSVSSSWQQLRKAGATARAMLVEAAAEQWEVPVSELRTERGVVLHPPTDRRAAYGELADYADTLLPPDEVPLKAPEDFRLVGRSLRRLEAPEKVTGRARFGLDMDLPDMLTALVARSPVPGGRVKAFDPGKAQAVPGVVAVKQVPSGVAVIGKGFWAAKTGRDALAVEWDPGEAATLSTEGMRAQYTALLEEPGAVARSEGDAAGVLAGAASPIRADYELPYLAHAPMEPLNCTVHVKEEGAEVWVGTQFQTVDRGAAAQVLGLAEEQVNLHTQLLGGGFGRRATPASDFVREAAHVAKGMGVPVKTVWTREDDTRGGYYRPFVMNRLSGALDEDGLPVAWSHRLVSQSIIAGTPFEQYLVKDGVDETSVEGAADLPYAIPNLHVDLHSPKLPVPVLWWRSVGHSHTAFSVESFLDELAHAGGHDPLALRRRLLDGNDRLLRVLDLAAEKAGWGEPLPAGHGRGVALRESFGSVVAEVAEVAVDGGQVKVLRVVCAVDCGRALNPGNVAAQMQSAMVLGLTAAAFGEITLADGRVQQSNFHDYPPLRMAQMPAIAVHILPSEADPTGVGEPGLPPIAPAVANAIFAASGQRVRTLPFSRAGLTLV